MADQSKEYYPSQLGKLVTFVEFHTGVWLRGCLAGESKMHESLKVHHGMSNIHESWNLELLFMTWHSLTDWMLSSTACSVFITLGRERS